MGMLLEKKQGSEQKVRVRSRVWGRHAKTNFQDHGQALEESAEP